MPESAPPRPSQVTIAGWLVVGGSVAVVLMAFDTVSTLHSLDTRERLERYLADGGKGLGLTVSGMQTIVQVAAMVAAATGAATAILGWQVLQRSKGARIALSALAVPLFVTGLTSSGFAPAVVAAAVVTLWFQPARDWFDGITRAPLPQPPPLAELPAPLLPPPHPRGMTPPRPRAVPLERPGSITWACLVTWVCTGALVLVFGLATVQFLVTPGVYYDEMRRQNPDLDMSDGDIRTLILVLLTVIVVWSALAATFAFLVWRRVAWAAVALGVSAGLACLTLLPVIACVAVCVMLLRPDAREWLQR